MRPLGEEQICIHWMQWRIIIRYDRPPLLVGNDCFALGVSWQMDFIIMSIFWKKENEVNCDGGSL